MRRLPPVVRDPLKGAFYQLWPELVWTRESGTYDWWVVSGGGMKTTMLMEFLAEHGAVNDPHRDPHNLKHLARPPRRLRPRRMFVYVHGDPVRAVLSLYRRGYANAQSRKLGRLGRPLPPTVAGYAERGVDALGLTRHLRTWTSARVPVPIAYVDSERLWSDVPRLLRVLGVDADAATFPAERERAADLEPVEAATRERLERIYRPYRELTAGLAAIDYRAPR